LIKVSPPSSKFTDNFTSFPSDPVLKALYSRSNTSSDALPAPFSLSFSPPAAHDVTTSLKSHSSPGFQHRSAMPRSLSQPSAENPLFYDLEEGEFDDLFFTPELDLDHSFPPPSSPPSGSARLAVPTLAPKAVRPQDQITTADMSLPGSAWYEAGEAESMAKAIQRLEQDVRRMAAEIEVLHRLIRRSDSSKDIDIL